MNWELLARYLVADCTPQERRRVERWLAADPAHRETLAVIQAAGESGKGEFGLGTRGQGNNRESPIIVTPLSEAKRRRAGSARERTPVRRRRAWVAAPVAAGVIAAAGATFAIRAWTSPRRGLAVAMLADSTARGESKAITFADGTRLVLAPASILHYPEHFGPRSRDVTVDGEAYIDVAHNRSRPFRVHVRGLVTEDLGTAFVVRAFRDDPRVRVVVASGRVAVKDTARRYPDRELVPGDLGEIGADGTVTLRSVDAAQYTAWTHGRLAYSDAPVREVLADLSRWLNVNVSTKDTALAARRMSASFSRGPADALLHNLAMSLGAGVTKDGGRTLFTMPTATATPTRSPSTPTRNPETTSP